jgi:Mg-chelatase subunit ChlD
MANTKKKRDEEQSKKKSLHDFLLLDRSGSMSTKWMEALSSINTYCSELAKKPETKNTKITVATFDGQGGLMFDVVRDGIAVTTFPPLTDADASPRGMTPLYDAVIRLVALAESNNPDNCAIVIMTDGHENASREASKDTAEAALARAKKKGWSVTFLGAEFRDVYAQSASLGVDAGGTIAVSAANLSQSMNFAAQNRASYAVTQSVSDMDWTEQQREKVEDKKVAKK